MISGTQPEVYGAEAHWRRTAAERLGMKIATGPWAQDLAAGVAAWCVRSVGPRPVRLDQIDAWIAHALCAVGQTDAANRMAPPGRRPFPSAVSATRACVLARDGILSAGPPVPGGESPGWKLDLHRLAGADPCLELRAYRIIRAAVERITDAWQEAGVAQPRLALTGLRRLARNIEGPRARDGRIRRRAADLFSMVRGLLDRCGRPDVSLCILEIEP